MKSKRSKAMDQRRISIAEIKKDKNLLSGLRATKKMLEKKIKKNNKETIELGHHLLRIDFRGGRGMKRLENTAHTRKMCAVVYFLKHIAPKL